MVILRQGSSPTAGEHSPFEILTTALKIVVALILALSILIECGWSEDLRATSMGTAPFHIPRQPLAAALERFARESGLEILYESGIVAGLQSSPLDGNYTRDAALKTLLLDADLTVHYARPNAITLSVPDAGGELPPENVLADADFALETLHVKGAGQAFDSDRLSDFSASVQLDIERALRRNAKTRAGSYQVAVRVWIDGAQRISRVVLARPSGDVDRDDSIPVSLVGLALSRPVPGNLPQPIQVLITVRSL